MSHTDPPTEPESVLLAGHDVPLGRHTTVRRLLPHRRLRMVGAWCFVDAFGPDEIAGRTRRGMQIPPHPHTGLQTVTWLVEGEIVHRDSLGNQQRIRPGQLNLMTAGAGIAHCEQGPADLADQTRSPQTPAPRMHGLQLWVALPNGARSGPPAFASHADVPQVHSGGLTATVVVGEFDGARSAAEVHTPLLGVELQITDAGTYDVPADVRFEHAVLALSGAASVAGSEVAPGSLLHLPEGRSRIRLQTDGPARLFLLGGEPFEEPLVMWWNFVGRTHEEIARAREDWMSGLSSGSSRFGTVPGCADAPLPAPDLPTVRLKARDRHGRSSP